MDSISTSARVRSKTFIRCPFGGKARDGERLAPLREDVRAPRFHFDALDPAVVTSRQWSQVVVEVVAGPLLVIGDGFDIDQCAREFENVHKMSVWGEGEGEESTRAGRMFQSRWRPPRL